MRRTFEVWILLFFSAAVQASAALGQFSNSGSGIIIGKIEARVEGEWDEVSSLIRGIEVEIVRAASALDEEPQESVEARTSAAGVFMAPMSSLDGTFRIARIKLPESKDWIDIGRVSVKGDMAAYGASAFRRYGGVVALNPLLYEEGSDGQSKFVMIVGPFSDICLNFLEAFPLSPWKDAVEEARTLSLRREVDSAEGDEEEAAAEPVEAKPAADVAEARLPSRIRLSDEVEEAEESSRGTTTVIITSLVLVILAIMVGIGGRRRRRPKEREIDISEIELMEAEREKQIQDEAPAKEQPETDDPTAILIEKEGWFLREFRRARVRIHWKKYDSAAVSLEKTTSFMEEHIDRLEDRKEIYTLVLHYSYLGRCYLESGRYGDALRIFRRGIGLNEYNSRMCEMGLADTLDAIARSEKAPTLDALSAKYPLLTDGELEAIIMMSQSPSPKE